MKTLDTNKLTLEQKAACLGMHRNFNSLGECAEVHCRTQEEYLLANYVAGILGRLDLEIILEAQQQLSK